MLGIEKTNINNQRKNILDSGKGKNISFENDKEGVCVKYSEKAKGEKSGKMNKNEI